MNVRLHGHFLLGIMITGLATVSASADAPTEARPVFFADYSRKEKSVEGMGADGRPIAPAAILHADDPTFDFDLMAHTVRGLTVGAGCASVSYPTAGCLPAAAGTLELTVKPQDWEGDDEQIHMLLQTMVGGKTEFGKLFVYKYKQAGLAVYFEFTQEGDSLFLHTPVSSWRAQTWRHVALTYELPGALRLYVDGRVVAEGRADRGPPWPETFSVGPWSETFGRHARTTIGLVAFHDRALTPQALRALAAKRLPELRDALAEGDSPQADEVSGRRSPWFEAGRPSLGREALDPDYVPPPWSPVEQDGASLTVWNRAYAFGGTGAVSAIRSAGADLLSAPLDILVDGRALSFSAPAVVKTAGGRVDLKREGQHLGRVVASWSASVLYDGLVLCELAFPAGLPAGTETLTLRIALNEPDSRFVHYVGALRQYESQNLPRNSYSIALPAVPGSAFASAFRTTLWLGGNQRGLLWYAESDQFWWPKDRPDCIRVSRREDGSAELHLRLVSGAYPLKDVRPVFRFGLMATPVRPMPSGWRGWTFTAQYDSIKGAARGDHLIYWPDQWRFMSLDPDPHRARQLESNRARNARDHAAGRKIIPYWSRLHHPDREGKRRLPDVDEMRRRWATEPNRPGGGSQQLFRCSTTTGWADYLVWCTVEWPRVMGWLDGVYIDETQPIPNTRAASGGGYDCLSGTRRPTFEFQGSRALYQRMMYLIRQRNHEPARSIAHCSATHTMQCLSPFTIMLVGEQYYSGYFRENPERLPPDEDRVYYYSYALPMERLRAECYWKQWGMVMLWLPCLKNQEDILRNPLTTRDMLSRVMQADMLVWPLFCNADEVRGTWAFRREFGIDAPGVRFVPYWENTLITAAADNVVVGYYQAGERFLALVSNLNREPRTVSLDLKRLPPVAVRNAENGMPLPVSEQGVTLRMRRNDYSALVLMPETAAP